MTHHIRPVALGAIAIALGGVVAALGVSAVSSPQSAPIDALVVPERVDLGEAVRGGLVKFSFEIENADARQPLRIEYLSTSCGCTTLDVETPLTIAPGGAREIKGLLRLTPLEHREDYSASVYFGTSSARRAQRAELYTRLVDPLPDTAVVGDDGVVVMAFDPRYQALTDEITVYPHNSDTPLPSELSDAQRLLRVSTPASLQADLDRLEVVIDMRDAASSETYRLVYEVALSR